MVYLSVINEKIGKFFVRNASMIYKLVFVLIFIVAFFTFSHKYTARKERILNQKLFDIVNNDGSDLKLLEELYKNNSLKSNNKLLTGLVLAKEYIKLDKIENAIKVYDDLHEMSGDTFIRDFAGYNLFRLALKNYDANKILNIYNALIGENSSMSDLVKEQYSLYLLENNRIDEAKIILKKNQKNEDNEDLFNRIKLYKIAYKF